MYTVTIKIKHKEVFNDMTKTFTKIPPEYGGVTINEENNVELEINATLEELESGD
jgi:hypothetical protein